MDAPSPDTPGEGSVGVHNRREWWRRAVIYQIYIRSFADSDGDGVGDLSGIRSRLGYLRDLGVDAIWVTPFYPSPMVDGGYDVADYRNIDPLFGSVAEAEALVAEAHASGLRVLIDIVPNHSSDQHPWFQAALSARPESPERGRYVFRRGRGPDEAAPPTDWESTFGGSAWTQLPDGDWYLHLFAPEQPDFNWENAEVVEDFTRTLRFWLDRGVDGFRVDVAHALKKDQAFPDVGSIDPALLASQSGPDHPIWDRDDVHEIYRGWRKVLEEYGGERAFVAEAWVKDPRRLALYVRPDELHTAFNFPYLRAPWHAATLRSTIDACLATTHAVGAPTTWVLSNHDVTRHATRYGRLDDDSGGLAQIDRAGPETPVDAELGLRRARAAALLTLALPGSAYLYQGEELGLPDVVDLPEEVLQDPIWTRSQHTERGRDGARVPLPWTRSGPSFGFGPGQPWLPQPPSWADLSVEAQQGSSGSTLELYRAALSVRRAKAAFVGDGLTWLPAPRQVLAFRREDEDSGSAMVCVVNVADAPVDVTSYGVLVLASGPLEASGALPPATAAWLRP